MPNVCSSSTDCHTDRDQRRSRTTAPKQGQVAAASLRTGRQDIISQATAAIGRGRLDDPVHGRPCLLLRLKPLHAPARLDQQPDESGQ